MQTDRRPLTVQQKASLSRAGISLDVIHTLTRGTAAALIATALAPSARTTAKKSRHVEDEEGDDDDSEEEESEDNELEPGDDRGDPDDHDRKPPKRGKSKKHARLPVAPAALSGETDLSRTKRVLQSHLDAMSGGRTSIALADDPVDHFEAPYQLDSKPYETLPADLRKAVRQGLDPATAYVIALERR
jgi:hypothetical protein